MKTFIFTSMLIVLPFFTACSQSGKEHVINTQTERSLDLKRYLGKWYEIARFDHPFERNMVGVTAEYSMRPDGKIRVLNSGYKGDLNGKFKTAEGKARQPDPKEPGKLEVAFFLWFYGDYNILELDERNYAYVLIGSSSDKYLWILSRTPQLPEETIKMLLDKATERGYDTSKLIWVKQK
ncbi:MAG: lipocalin family protein [Parabacteroides sp.]|nr:lipocalin family protein [Parabacteroides sp.]